MLLFYDATSVKYDEPCSELQYWQSLVLRNYFGAAYHMQIEAAGKTCKYPFITGLKILLVPKENMPTIHTVTTCSLFMNNNALHGTFDLHEQCELI